MVCELNKRSLRVRNDTLIKLDIVQEILDISEFFFRQIDAMIVAGCCGYGKLMPSTIGVSANNL